MSYENWKDKIGTFEVMDVRGKKMDFFPALKAKAAVKKAFEYQLNGKGFSFVEFLSNCPTNWAMTPAESLEHIKNVTSSEFPLGEFRAK